MRMTGGCAAWIVAAALIGCGGSSTDGPPVAGPARVSDANPATPTANDWPWWRGAALRNHATGDPPLTWSETQHIVWKAPLPGRGHASPIVWGDAVFIATADATAGTQSLLCFDRATGARRWATEVHRGSFIGMHRKNSHASATPAADGQRVYTAFAIDDALFVSAIDFHGEIVWQKRVGDFHSEHGYGSSPVIHRSMVIVTGDNKGPSYVAALDRATGELVWKTPRPDEPSYGTPVVFDIAGRSQLIVHGGDRTHSYNPDTGELRWTCQGPADIVGNTPVADDAHVYVSGGYPQKKLMAIRADGAGDVSATHVTWSTSRAVSYVPSALLHDGRVYVVTDGGIAACIDATTGEAIWRARLDGAVSSSPVLVGDRIYVGNERGVTHVYKAAEQFELLATNELPGGIMATPAIIGDRIYLRTSEALYCIGAHETAAASD